MAPQRGSKRKRTPSSKNCRSEKKSFKAELNETAGCSKVQTPKKSTEQRGDADASTPQAASERGSDSGSSTPTKKSRQDDEIENSMSPSVRKMVPQFLNNDCLRKIYSYLPFTDRVRLQRVNSQWLAMGQQMMELRAEDFLTPPSVEGGEKRFQRGKMEQNLRNSKFSLRRLVLTGLPEERHTYSARVLLSGMSCPGVQHAEMPYAVLYRLHHKNCMGPYGSFCPTKHKRSGFFTCLPRVTSLVLRECCLDNEDKNLLERFILPHLKAFDFDESSKGYEHGDFRGWVAFYLSLSPDLQHLALCYKPDHLMHLLVRLRQTPSLPELASLTLRKVDMNKEEPPTFFLSPEHGTVLQDVYEECMEAAAERGEWNPFELHSDKPRVQMFHALCLLLAPQITQLEVEAENLSGDHLRSLSLLHKVTSLKLTLVGKKDGTFRLADVRNILVGMPRLQTLHFSDACLQIYGALCDLIAALSGLTDLRDLRIPFQWLSPHLIQGLPCSLRSLTLVKGSSTLWIPTWSTWDIEEKLIRLVELSADLWELNVAARFNLSNAQDLLDGLEAALKVYRPPHPDAPKAIPLRVLLGSSPPAGTIPYEWAKDVEKSILSIFKCKFGKSHALRIVVDNMEIC